MTTSTPPRRRRPPPSTPRRTFWIRRAVALLVVLLGGWLVVTVLGAIVGLFTGGSGDKAKTSAAARPGQLAVPKLPDPTYEPGGGRTIFPGRRVVAFYGNPMDTGLGALGIGTPDQASQKLLRVAKDYSRKTRPILPALELITSVAAYAPGPSGLYRNELPAKQIDRYLAAARKVHAILLLDIQPGHATFPAEVKRLKRWLVQPDVGLALDPEWRLGPGQIPGQVIGSVDASEINAVSLDLSMLVRERNLPDKIFLIHEFTQGMIKRKSLVQDRPGLETVYNVDGVGDRPNKISKYKAFAPMTPRGAHLGFKVFFKEDTNRMSPSSVMALQPRPEFVVYE